jgi:CubicO group peptidase (beta-lactamase class C family)
MTHSYFDVTPFHLLKYRSNNYYVRGGEAGANGLDFDTGVTVSNGGLNAPLADMARYLRFLLGATPGEANPISRATLEEMWRPVSGATRGEVIGSQIGLGYFLEERGGVRMVGHTGSQAGFRSFFWVVPDKGLAIIANFNTSPAPEVSAKDARPNIARVFDGLMDRFAALARATPAVPGR